MIPAFVTRLTPNMGLTAAWQISTSPNTPKTAPNGDPNHLKGRYFTEGDRHVFVWPVQPPTGDVNLCFDLHDVPTPGFPKWGTVAPIHVEWVNDHWHIHREYGGQTGIDCPPAKGLVDGFDVLTLDIVFSRSPKIGLLSAYWNGVPVGAFDGPTLNPDPAYGPWAQLWQGSYNSSGISAPGSVVQAAALVSQAGGSLADALADTPILVEQQIPDGKSIITPVASLDRAVVAQLAGGASNGGGMNVKVNASTPLAVTLKWDPVPTARGFVYTIDGSDKLTDGKRHFTMDGTKTSVKIGMPQDGKTHVYGVEALTVLDQGTVTHPAVADPSPAPPDAGHTVWAGNYTAAFPGWDGVQRKAADRIVSVAGSVLGQPDGPWAKFTVKPGDFLDPAHPQSERAQLDNFKNSHGTEGQTGVWAWSTLFDPAYSPQVTSFPLWNVYQQWQHAGFVGQAMFNYQVDAAKKQLVLSVNNGDPARPTQKNYVLDGAFKPGKRYDHAFPVCWSSDPLKGWFEVWLNGVNVVPRSHGATLYRDGTQALAIQMLYRQAHASTDVVFQTGLRLADSLAGAVKDFPAW